MLSVDNPHSRELPSISSPQQLALDVIVRLPSLGMLLVARCRPRSYLDLPFFSRASFHSSALSSVYLAPDYRRAHDRLLTCIAIRLGTDSRTPNRHCLLVALFMSGQAAMANQSGRTQHSRECAAATVHSGKHCQPDFDTLHSFAPSWGHNKLVSQAQRNSQARLLRSSYKFVGIFIQRSFNIIMLTAVPG